MPYWLEGASGKIRSVIPVVNIWVIPLWENWISPTQNHHKMFFKKVIFSSGFQIPSLECRQQCQLFVLGSSKTASDKFFATPGKVYLEMSIITDRKKSALPAGPQDLWLWHSPSQEVALIQETFSLDRLALKWTLRPSFQSHGKHR